MNGCSIHDRRPIFDRRNYGNSVYIGRPVLFEWDDAKERTNLAKHGVLFSYAARVFLDGDVLDFDASRLGDGEMRRKAVGRIDHILFTVVYTVRGKQIRLISARRSNVGEARAYGSLRP